MPIYEYECPNCGVFEDIVPQNTDIVQCKKCGAKSHKIMSLSNFALKGTGWYATDYKNKSSKNASSESA